jgi:hypothetical protein
VALPEWSGRKFLGYSGNKSMNAVTPAANVAEIPVKGGASACRPGLTTRLKYVLSRPLFCSPSRSVVEQSAFQDSLCRRQQNGIDRAGGSQLGAPFRHYAARHCPLRKKVASPWRLDEELARQRADYSPVTRR